MLSPIDLSFFPNEIRQLIPSYLSPSKTVVKTLAGSRIWNTGMFEDGFVDSVDLSARFSWCRGCVYDPFTCSTSVLPSSRLLAETVNWHDATE